MKKNIFLLLFAVFAQTVFAQNLLNIKSPEKFREEQEKLKAPKTTKSVMVEGEIQEVPLTPEELAAAKPTLKEKPVAFAPVEDKDILWSKVVWEVIDLNEKINQPFYYKSESTVDNFVSLYDALVDGMESGAIKEVYDDDSFVGRLEQKDFIMRTSRVDTTDYAINKINAGKTLEAGDLDYVKLNSNSVRLVKIMGMWYIDKRIGDGTTNLVF
ncbi:MAG: hypothetical protein C4K58_03315 [Flavobacteriaceae bacterium]|nr:MAG: hypothetical protein C4K58_03315 [Flavobacteriaceae bacterium]